MLGYLPVANTHDIHRFKLDLYARRRKTHKLDSGWEDNRCRLWGQKRDPSFKPNTGCSSPGLIVAARIAALAFLVNGSARCPHVIKSSPSCEVGRSGQRGIYNEVAHPLI